MELFKLEKNKVYPRPCTLLVREFKDIWEQKDKETALKELGAVYFISDYKSVYNSYSPDDREEVILEDLELKSISPKVRSAINKYKELQNTATMRYLDSQISALEELILYFKNVNFSERDKFGRPVYKPKEITSSMADASKVVESVEKLKQKVQLEVSELGKIRGGGLQGLYEDED